MNLCVYGAASDKVAPIYFEKVTDLGEKMAKRGYDLIYGGGDTGMMGAIARGVKKGGGKVFGVAPKYFDEPGVLFPDCDEMTYTDTIRIRKQVMEDGAVGFIATPGGIGTFDELFEMITLMQLDQTEKPIVVFNINGYFDPFVAMLHNMVEEGFLKETIFGRFGIFKTAEEVLDYIDQNRK